MSTVPLIDALYMKYGLTPAGHVGDGWVPLLDSLFEDLIALGWDKELHQVKEKFGDLRVYVGQATDEILMRICEAEIRSASMCEECGKPGIKTNKPGKHWIITACEEHRV